MLNSVPPVQFNRRENYGHGNINRGFPLVDALKVAAVDALKKCCSTFGIGLHLYDGDDIQTNASANNNGQHRGNGQYHEPPDFGEHHYYDYEADPTPHRGISQRNALKQATIRHRLHQNRLWPFKILRNPQRRIQTLRMR